ncbi:MAG: beta-propeller domain-containing protein [Burkholderiales bacterium]|nr:beta-propeller domain-containing protein [Burkholderiales bacterium]
MRFGHLVVRALALALLLTSFHSPAAAPVRTLTAFRDEAELKEWLHRMRPPRMESRRTADGVGSLALQAAPAAPAAMADAKTAASNESVTNNQVAGVDEGGIVKAHGEHLVILRRGRLFTVRLGSTASGPVAAVDAFGPGIDPAGAWYDEMLIDGDNVVVIGYSYARGGTEVGLFRIDRAGTLAHRGTWHLRSNDYYSSRNYASRMVGGKLVFYSPLYLNLHGDALAQFPAMRRWQADAERAEFRRIAPATSVYRTDDDLDPRAGIALHTVTICDLSGGTLDCRATAVLGPAGRVFHVAESSVYVWTSGRTRPVPGAEAAPARAQAAVFRLPLDGGAPTALKTSGSPIDQFSFLERDDHLNVLVRAQGRGEAMWSAETAAGDLALLRVPLAAFGDGRETAPAWAYKALARAEGSVVQNRFVGEHLLYGSGNPWGRARPAAGQAVQVVRYADASPARAIPLGHAIDRIEALGSDAVVVGSSGADLVFSTLRLGRDAALAHRLVRENAAQGETRSHGFFYKPADTRRGIIGLPIVGSGRPGHRQLVEGSAAVVYLRNDALRLSDIGTLEARAAGGRNDHCRASCVDWYGNARPLFLRNRVFALMGYEIVEGRVSGNRIDEVGRTSFAPGVPEVAH